MRRAHLNRNVRRWVAVVALGTASALAASGTAAAVEVTTRGPLTRLNISPDLNCDVRYDGDTMPSFFADRSCGTFASAGGALYGPEVIPSMGLDTVPWVPVSQTKTGTGDPGDPIVIVTTVTGGPLTVVETDTYTIGDNYYRTDIAVTNSSSSPFDAIVYHAADCYLQDSDKGFTELDTASGTTTCRAPDANHKQSASGRIEQFIPLTPDSAGVATDFGTAWNLVASGSMLPNTATAADTPFDNGMGLSWAATLGSGETRKFSLLTNLSPLGASALTTTVTPDKSSTTVGDPITVRVDVKNPNIIRHTVPELKVTLPTGATYAPGSTTGTSEPTVDGNVATFKNLTVNAEGKTTFTFRVDTTNASPGTVRVELPDTTSSGGAPVMGSKADLTLTKPTPTPTPTAAPAPLTPTPTETQVAPLPTATRTPAATSRLAPAAALARTRPLDPVPASIPASANRSANALAQTGASGLGPITAIAVAALLAGTTLLIARRRKSQH